jgi:hypothetical protein
MPTKEIQRRKELAIMTKTEIADKPIKLVLRYAILYVVIFLSSAINGHDS